MNHLGTISSPSSQFTGFHYLEILDNVASRKVLFDLTVQLKKSLKWPSLKISEYDLEMKIWEVHWKLHELERWDEDPRDNDPRHTLIISTVWYISCLILHVHLICAKLSK